MPRGGEFFDVGANIERILLRRGVPTMYAEAKICDFPKSVQDQVDCSMGGHFICGPCGLGKTRLAIAIMREAVLRGSAGAYKIDTCVRGILNAQFVPVTGLLMRIKNSFQAESVETEAEIIGRVSDSDFLVFDDLGAEKATDWTMQTLYTIIDIRAREKRPTIITSNLSLGEISERMGDRISSRIGGMCKVISLQGKDKRLERDSKMAAAHDV